MRHGTTPFHKRNLWFKEKVLMDPNQELIIAAWARASPYVVRKEIESQQIILGTNMLEKVNQRGTTGFKFKVLSPIHPQLRMIFDTKDNPDKPEYFSPSNGNVKEFE